MKAFLCDFVSHCPRFSLDQNDSLEWLKQFHEKFQRAKFLDGYERVSKYLEKFGVGNHHINRRQSYVQNVNSFNWTDYFFNEEDLNPTLDKRSEKSQQVFEEIFNDFYHEDSNMPEHIFHATCTHYNSPSAPQLLVQEKRCPTMVTHLYHMGCYAALPAVRCASAQVQSGAGHVDIVNSEICSIHLNPEKFTPEQIVVQSLFSDGAIKYSCLNEETFNRSHSDGLEVLALKEIIIPDTANEMTWKLGQHRFNMTLSKRLPKILEYNIEAYCVDLFSKAGLNYHDAKNETEFAIHPGGPQIISSIQKTLSLEDVQVENSKLILKQYGNMSSATLPHIWAKVTKSNYKYIATMAFGPGLTVTGGIFKVWKKYSS